MKPYADRPDPQRRTSRSFLSIGECMVEIAPAEEGLHRLGYAGDMFNTAWYARRCLPPSWDVSFASALGTDETSDDMLAFMAAEGVGTGALKRIDERTVGLYLIRLRDGERSFAYWREKSAARALADDPNWLSDTLSGRQILCFSGITLAILPPAGRRALCAALSDARAEGSRIAFDTNVRPRLWESDAALRQGLELGASVADVVLPSFDEERAVFEDGTPGATIDRYRALGATTVVVKDGGAPITAWSATETVTISPPHVPNVVDTTAAGDSFAAAFLAAEADGAPLDAAVGRAARLSASVVQTRGALAAGLFD